MTLHTANPPSNYTPPTSLKSPFTLPTDLGTDLWRKPPSTFSFSAPILYHTLPLSSLQRARISFSGSWRTLYDQGGLCLILPQPSTDATVDPKADPRTKWIKTGVEFTHDAPHISTVACDRWADWSLLPFEGEHLTVEMEREVKRGEKTTTLWIYAVDGEDGSKRRPLREVTWAFEDADAEGGRECRVGAYAARPSKDTVLEAERLEVKFWDLSIETWDGVLEV